MATRDWKHEYQLQKKRGEDKDQIERQKARRAYDKKGVNRAGKDIDHITDRKSTRLNSSHVSESRMPSSA